MPASKSPKAPKVSYHCTECGWSSPKWMGQCRECREWGTLEETQVAGAPGGSAGGALGAAGAVAPAAPSRAFFAQSYGTTVRLRQERPAQRVGACGE